MVLNWRQPLFARLAFFKMEGDEGLLLVAKKYFHIPLTQGTFWKEKKESKKLSRNFNHSGIDTINTNIATAQALPPEQSNLEVEAGRERSLFASTGNFFPVTLT